MRISKPCFYCAGTGTIEMSIPAVGFCYHEHCPVCGGKGRIRARYADFVVSLDKYACENCEGRGEVGIGSFNTHPHCYDTATCGTCHGEGHIFPTYHRPKPELFQLMNLEPVNFPSIHR